MLFAFALCLAVAGQLAAKAGALGARANDILNPFLALSLLFLFTRGLVWAAVLRRERLAFAYPVMALAYPLMLVLARVVFGEVITPAKVFGSLLIVTGVVVLGLGEKTR